jgi:hydroxyacylglutathione hydrolase
MKIHLLPILEDNYSYILQAGNQAIIVDPGAAEPLLSFCKKNKIEPAYILVTHHHWDHTDGIEDLKNAYSDIQVIGPLSEENKIGPFDQKITDGATFDLLGLRFQAIETPGHTNGHLCYWLAEENIFLSGDMLFAAGCGRPMEGSAEDLFHSMQKLKFLSEKTKIYCGHEYTLTNLAFARAQYPDHAEIQKRIEKCERQRVEDVPTIPFTWEEELQTNPFVFESSREKFVELRKARNKF